MWGQSCCAESSIGPRSWRGGGQASCSKWGARRESLRLGLSFQLWQDSHRWLCGLCTAHYLDKEASRGSSPSCYLFTTPRVLMRD